MDALEQLLAEFFGPGTSTDRKRAIEAQLESQRPTMDDCRYLLLHARSDYVAWFAASQYQKRIQATWGSLDPDTQHTNRSFLFIFLQQQSQMDSGSIAAPELEIDTRLGQALGNAAAATRFSPFVLNKVIQLLTDVALLDWPDRFQDLFPEIHRLLQSKSKEQALLGWTLLEAVVQEFVGTYPAPGSGTSQRVHFALSQQKRYLWEQFKVQVPDLLALIVQHLDTCYNKTLVAPLSTEAPAPSPVEHSLWGASAYGRRPSIANNSSFQNSFSGSRAVPGSMGNSFAASNLSSSFLGQTGFHQDQGQRHGSQSDQGAANSYGKSPTTTLRKTLSQFLGGPTNANDSGIHLNPGQSSLGSGSYFNQTRQRMGSISDLGQMAMRRSSINAAALMGSRRNSVESTFVTGSKMDSHTRKTCMLALRTLTTLLSCTGLDPRQISFSASITAVLRFSTLHQNKTVDLGILAMSCLNGLVARPGFLATNQETMTSAVRIIADLIRYFNEVKDGIDDIDESYLQMFMHFVSLFCTWSHLERAEKALNLSIPDFLLSFARFTLEKVSVDYLKVCMDVWKSLLDALIHAATEVPRPLPVQHPLRRIQGTLLSFMSALVEKFYQMKGATQSEDAFSTFEVEDEEDLDDLTELVESLVGSVGEIFTEEVIEMLNPLLNQQLDLYSRREFEDCKTLPVTLGILSRVSYNFLQNFEHRRDYTSNLVIYLTRMTKLSVEFYVATTADATSPGKDKAELTGTITLALFSCLQPLVPWLAHLWKVETNPETDIDAQTRAPVGRDIYQELAQISTDLFRKLLATSSSQLEQSVRPNSALNTFLGPATMSCSAMDRKLLLACVKTLGAVTLQVRIPTALVTTGSLLFWELHSIRDMATCMSQNVLSSGSFMGSINNAAEDRTGLTPDDELYCLAYIALSNGIVLDPKTSQEQQAFSSLVAPLVYPLQSTLQDSKSAPATYLSSDEVKFRVHRSLVVLRSILDSVSEAAVASRALVFEGMKSALPLVQEYFELYFEDQDILMFFKTLVKSLHRQIGTGYCMEVARVLMERLTSPTLLETALSTQTLQQQNQALHQRSFIIRQRKALERIQLSISVLKAVLELPGKDISLSIPEFIQFLFMQLGPKLLSVQSRQSSHSAMSIAGSSPGGEESAENAVNELMTLFYGTVQTLLSQHSRYFFANSRVGVPNASTAVTEDGSRLRALQSCMEFLARGLHSPQPEQVRQTIEILCALQDHSLCRLFDRQEFQATYRFEFLQIIFRMALNHQHDLLLEDMAGLVHNMVKGEREGDDKFLGVWHGDLKRFVASLEPSQVLVSTGAAFAARAGSGSPPHLLSSPGHTEASLSPSGSGTNAQFSDAMKEALWMGLARLGDESCYREGLYEFVNDAQVYAQSLTV
ncbi:Exportin-6 [Mortierella alpina]|uniref:Exportin-6 n=1 Tax=Mortierella alpina TaxID=64518 RepID=A0A9P6J4M9_MORAP|nr:Exportin-6 [Mortierella alpina]